MVDTILRRMPDYVNHIVPQFGVTHVNFQRVPTVDTSNPFIARDIPSADESMVIIRFTNPKGIDFPYLLSMLHDSAMTRPNTIIVPGGKMGLAMQLIFTPMILRLMDHEATRALGRFMNAPLQSLVTATDRRRLANALRFLAIDAVEAAKSGHPGMPMGMADIAEVLWRDHLKHDPAAPRWADRDRFVLQQRPRFDAALCAAASDRL